ncbi:MAG: ATP-binding protein [Bryobacter sp.]|nr:ATP-binding protein [Bryobacter sp.]
MVYFERDISDKLRVAAREYPALVLTGARQAGKTTLLRHLFPEHRFVSLDLPQTAAQAENNPEAFFEDNPGPLLIDEVQYAPRLFRHLKRLIDAERHTMGRFVLTGSQQFPLMKDVAESLAGRIAVFALENLSLRELSLAEEASWGQMLVRGGFPELWRQPGMDVALYYSSYVATYLERDVRQVLEVRNLRDMERFLRACAVRSGQLLNMADLARDVGISAATARGWLSVLEGTNQVTLLEPYFENLGKRLVKAPKLYLNDVGLLCFLLEVNEGSLGKSPLLRSIWETFVFGEIRKQIVAAATKQSVWFLRDAHGKEADFVWLREGRMDLLEAKWQELPERRAMAQLRELAEWAGRSKAYQRGRTMMVTRTGTVYEEEGVRVTNPGRME